MYAFKCSAGEVNELPRLKVRHLMVPYSSAHRADRVFLMLTAEVGWRKKFELNFLNLESTKVKNTGCSPYSGSFEYITITLKHMKRSQTLRWFITLESHREFVRRLHWWNSQMYYLDSWIFQFLCRWAMSIFQSANTFKYFFRVN